MTCFPTAKGLILTLDLLPQPGWKWFANGKLTADKARPDLQKAVDSTMKFVRTFFSEVRDKDVSMRLFVHSEHVGVWENGKLQLTDDKND